MKESAYHILRVGVAITFLWIGILIFKEPQGWGGYLQPWILPFLPFSIKEVMISTAIFDILVGAFLLIDYYTFFAALLGFLHLVIVLTVSGINSITVRDIGLLAAALALTLQRWPLKNDQSSHTFKT